MANNGWRLLVLLLLTAASLAGLAERSHAQIGNAELFGKVTFVDNGKPANARIKIGRRGKYRAVRVRTVAGRNQGYRITRITLGRYELIVTAPGAKARRIWGIKIGSFEKKELNIKLRRARGQAARFYEEVGYPLVEDLPRDWEECWVEGILLSSKGVPVEGTIDFMRASKVFYTVRTGTPTLPAYFELRNLRPGTYNLRFTPSLNVGLKPAIIKDVLLNQRRRNVLAPIIIPEGRSSDLAVTLPAPEIQQRIVPLRPLRRRRR